MQEPCKTNGDFTSLQKILPAKTEYANLTHSILKNQFDQN